MTPFMLAVQALLDGEEVPKPTTEPSQTRSIAVATDTQFIARSLAEQLVSEANAILAEHGNRITLVDDSEFGELGFTLGYRDRSARVQTVLSGHTAVGRLVLPGRSEDEPRQLTTGDELQALVLSLLADRPHH
jgi:hypothetical protein